MRLANLLMQMAMIFVTDFDGTLVHVHSPSPSPASSSSSDTPPAEIIDLPASSGSGQVAAISRRTTELLDAIGRHAVIICASGMRASTMLQREQYVPAVAFFACENGGRIFKRAAAGQVPTELLAWRERIMSDAAAVAQLEAFAAALAAEGWHVDRADYHTMIRVKGTGVQALAARVPALLRYTSNLGHLDVQLPGCSKLTATRWIIDTQLDGAGSSSSGSSDSSSDSGGGECAPFYFMGDDDNDVEIAAAAAEAFVASPCSAHMRAFVDHWSATRTGAGTAAAAAPDGVAALLRGQAVTVSHLHEAPAPHHAGTEALLERVLQKVTTPEGR